MTDLLVTQGRSAHGGTQAGQDRATRRRRRSCRRAGSVSLVLASIFAAEGWTVPSNAYASPLGSTTSPTTSLSTEPDTPSAPAAAAPYLPAGRQGSAASIPWSEVGPGWLLSEWSPDVPAVAAGGAAPNGGPGKPVPSTLSLIDPLGGRYTVATGAAVPSGSLVAWSGDGRRALFDGGGSLNSSWLTVLALQSGKTSKFRITDDGGRWAGFTEPDGLAVVAGGEALYNGAVPVQRYSLDGTLEHTYPTSFARAGRIESGPLLYSPEGTELVLPTSHGFEVVSNGGRPVRFLPMSVAAGTCVPLRWWAGPPNGDAIMLASCNPQPASSDNYTPVLWLVDTDGGAAPVQLTATPSPSATGGTEDAWELPWGVYVEVGSFCNNSLAELNPSGKMGDPSSLTTVPVAVPGAYSEFVAVLGAYGDQLALNTYDGCTAATSSLMWFNPHTKAVTQLMGSPPEVPYVSEGSPTASGYVEGAILFGQTVAGL